MTKSFLELFEEKEKQRKSLTENGAIAYESSGKKLLDFNFKLIQYRNLSSEHIQRDYAKVFFEDPVTAMKYMFYVGDVREGLGERRTFRECFDWLATNKPGYADALLEQIPKFTRWDNLVRLVDRPDFRDEVLDIITAQLAEDVDNMKAGKSISLLAKWMPSANASSKETKNRAKLIIKSLEISEKDYRKTLSSLRAYLNIVEVKASANEWDKIDYESVPSQANIKYKDAFMKHDSYRRTSYLESLKKGTSKINASVTQPHEIVRSYVSSIGIWGNPDVKSYDESLEQIWKALPSILTEDTLVVRDGSGSMTSPVMMGSKTTCLDVATALAIYCAEHNSESWKDKFITFSSHPRFVSFKNCVTLRDKLVTCYGENDCSNTDIEATMQLILDTAVDNNLEQSDMPKNILIISDMQFDAGRGGWSFNWDESLFDSISREYREAGYKLPKIIFWNVCDRNHSTIPMQDNELGLILCSGFSTNNVKMFMSGEIDPYKVLLEQLNSDRYAIIEELVKDK